MKLQLKLDHRAGASIPIDYRYYFSSWIYKVISTADHDFGQWLHDQGFREKHKKFKLFCFGDIKPRSIAIKAIENRIVLRESPSTVEVSFYIDDAMKRFIEGVFIDQRFALGDKDRRADFIVREAQLYSEPQWESEMIFVATSPILIKQSRGKREGADHIGPTADCYAELFIDNLIHKYQSVHGDEDLSSDIRNHCHFTLEPGTIKTKLHTVYGGGGRSISQMKGFLYTFKLKAPKELMRIGYYGGFGSQNSVLGYGMTNLIS